jgi:hypothetical protein
VATPEEPAMRKYCCRTQGAMTGNAHRALLGVSIRGNASFRER